MAQAELELTIPTASDKLRQNFPEDPKTDIQIEFKQRQFKLIKAHLRLQSNFFKRNLTVDRSILKINEDFDPAFFSNILECLYGACLKIKRKDVLDYFPIVQFLEIQCLIDRLKQDMVEHTSEYNFFRLFDVGYRYSDQQIFQKCLLYLEYRDYLQLKEQKQQMLGISQQLFKLIIKSHNRLPKEKRPLNPYEINHLIIQYCDYNKLQHAHRNSLKFQMIDKNNLSSNEYHDIFISDGSKTHEPQGRRFPARAFSLNPMRGTGHLHPHSLTCTTNFNLFHVTHKNLYLEMDTTFLKKISHQLNQQKEKLLEQIQSLSNETLSQNQKSKSTKKQFDLIRRKLCQRPNQQVISEKIKSIDSNLSEFEKSMSSQSQRLQSLFDSTNELLEKYEKQQKQLSISQSSCNSSLWNVNDKNQKVNDFVLIKNENKSNANKSNTSFVSKSQSEIREKEKEKDKDKDKSQANISVSTVNNQNKKDKENNKSSPYMKQTRLEFSKEPLIIKNMKQLQNLANLINPERFTKKRLKLLYRGQKGQKKNYIKASEEAVRKLREQLQYKSNVLFLFRTEFDKLIGAFSSQSLDFTLVGDSPDEGAFIFTVTEGKKFRVKPEQKNEAVQLNPGYLICFGTDLMISENLYEAENYCAWPSTYEGHSDKKERRSDWFVEDSQFAIKEIECYEVEDEGGDVMAI